MNKIYLPTNNNEQRAFDPAEILYFHSDGSYTHVYFMQGRMKTLRKPLKDVESSVDPMIFFRINKQSIINLNHIQSLQRDQKFTCVLSDGERLPVSRRRKKEFLKRLDQTNTLL